MIAGSDPQISRLPGGSSRVRAKLDLARNIATTQSQPAIQARIRRYVLYTSYPPFGGYKKSGIGRETHKMMLEHYRHTKNVLMSFDKNPMGFF